jgi:hypothetical protein
MGLSPAELGRLARASTVDVVEDDAYHSPPDPDDPKER